MATEILLPRLGWTMQEGTFGEWLKRDGETVTVGDLLYTVESDKALNEVETLEDGILYIPPDAPKTGDVIPVGARLGYLLAPGESAPSGHADIAPKREPLSPQTAVLAPSEPIDATLPRVAPSQPIPAPIAKSIGKTIAPIPAISPRAQRIANELGVDWAHLRGSGSSGRIVERDVRAAFEAQTALSKTAAQTNAVEAESGLHNALPQVRRVIAARLSESAHTTAPVTLTTEVDATELVTLREQLRADTAAQDPFPTYTDLLAKLCAHALLEHPILNARFEGGTIVMGTSVHIGIATDTERGLLVPVVRDVHTKSVRQLASETRPLIERARAGKATGQELGGGTFTITNLGMFEIDAFTPIINLPECAILGVGRIVSKLIVIDGAREIAVRQMMYLSLTFDHRLVDGAPAARFLQRVKELITRPYLWLVGRE
ncbi:MAG: 2-oxo acid dehydrogenase subunit E2 [Anaerolineae bacterium]|nr:2-oxo acid dehydrogenase subunit E2 [Anaerolineae bacterium]